MWGDSDNDGRIKVEENIDYSRGGVGYHERGINMHMRSGGRFFIDDPRAEDVNFDDIASSLAKLCRYTGHTGNDKNHEEFYSVAQHSVIVSRFVPPEMAMIGLLHDAAEAYIGDISKPMKLVVGSKIAEIEDRVYAAIAERFGLPPEIPKEVKMADLRTFATEKRDILSPATAEWGECPPPYNFKITPVGWRVAESVFRHRYVELLNRSPCG